MVEIVKLSNKSSYLVPLRVNNRGKFRLLQTLNWVNEILKEKKKKFTSCDSNFYPLEMASQSLRSI